jgi:tRNA threonylcarbamoyladenosine biosynthesis protein TsaB
MSKILCIETSTEVCSVAIAQNGRVLALREDKSGLNHSKLLTVFIDELLRENKLNVSDFAAVAVSRGPGSYTGLRIGVSAAKGLCYGAGIPLIAVCPLQAMAQHVVANCSHFGFELSDNDVFVPMIDARRMEVYAAAFNHKAETLSEVEALIIDEHAFSEELKSKRLFFFGNGAQKCKGLIAHQNAFFIDEIYSSAAHMAILAHKQFEAEKFVDTAYFEPFYLKDFIATKPKNSVLGKLANG